MVRPRSVGRAIARIAGPSCSESQRCFEERGPHLFGVCCIIRTRELATREYCSFFFFAFPVRGKRVLEIYYGTPCGRPISRLHFADRPADRPTGTSANTWPGGKDGFLSASGETSRNSCLVLLSRARIRNEHTVFHLPSRPPDRPPARPPARPSISKEG